MRLSSKGICTLLTVAMLVALLLIFEDWPTGRRQKYPLGLERSRKAADEKQADQCTTSARSNYKVALVCSMNPEGNTKYKCNFPKIMTTTATTITTTTISTARAHVHTTLSPEELENTLDTHVSKTNVKEETKELNNYFTKSVAALVEHLIATDDPVKRKEIGLKIQNTSLHLADMALEVYNDLHDSNRSALLTNVINSFESLSIHLANTLAKGERQINITENVEMFIKKVDLSLSKDESHHFTSGSFWLPEASLKHLAEGRDTIGVSCLAMMNTESYFADLLGKKESQEGKGKIEVFHTNIIMISVGSAGYSKRLPQNITLTFKLLNKLNPATVPKCYSLSSNNKFPSKDGCHGLVVNATHVECRCNHMTSFAVLMSVDRPSAVVSDPALSVLTKVCLALSVFFLILAFITFVTFSNLRSDRNTIHTHLSGCLAVAQLLFLVGADMVENKLACAVIAGILHFLFLTVFCWMAIEGLELYCKLVIIFSASRPLIPVFMFIGYVVPAIIVAISAGIYHQGYGTPLLCWLTTDKWFHFSFIGPVLVIILWNSIMLIVATCLMCRHHSTSQKDRTKSQQLKTEIKGVVSLLALLGVSWLLGLVSFGYTGTLVFQYIFILLNGCQGVFIFFFHCFTNEKVKKEYRRFVRNSNVLPEGFRRVCFMLFKTDSDTEFSKSAGPTSQYPGTITELRNEEPYKAPAPQARSAYQSANSGPSTVRDLAQSVEKQMSSIEHGVDMTSTTFKMKDLDIPETTANMIKDSGIYFGDDQYAQPAPSSICQGTFEMKDVPIPEVSDTMLEDAGIYFGDDAEAESGVYLGDSAPKKKATDTSAGNKKPSSKKPFSEKLSSGKPSENPSSENPSSENTTTDPSLKSEQGSIPSTLKVLDSVRKSDRDNSTQPVSEDQLGSSLFSMLKTAISGSSLTTTETSLTSEETSQN